MSVFEINHRSTLFNEIIDEAEQNLRYLMNIPDNYKVLFLQGGASLQFSAIPMNIMKKKKAGFILTGHWAERAYEEARMFGETVVLASSKDRNYSYIPSCDNLPSINNLDYIHICENNTIYGTVFHELPNTKGHILVSDQSSCFLSKPVDVTKYGIIYAGAQKNVGPAGTVIVIIREDLIPDEETTHVLPGTPTMLMYKTQADNDSLYNTPPTYGIYMCGKVFKWLLKNGGLEAIYKKNVEKANMLYDYLDNSKLFKGTVEKGSRSLMNVPFIVNPDVITDPEKKAELEAKFVKESKAAGLENLKGHRTVGGMRASIYNAMPKAGVEALVEFMKKFEAENLK